MSPNAASRAHPLGPTTIRTTSDRYAHLYQAARERLRDHLDATYGGAATEAEPA